MRNLMLALLACGSLAGCLDLDAERGQGSVRNRKIETPNLNEASVESASRVDQIGRQLVGQNPFLGLEPVFQTFGLPEPEIWHPDFHAVFITEGLVKQCSTDEELAGVLATELAKMAEEKRAATSVRRLEPLQPGSESALPGGNVAAQSHDLVINAMADKKLGQPARKFGFTEKEIELRAAEILQSAGYESKLVQQVKPVLQKARLNQALSRQFGDRSDAPVWSR